MTEPDRRPLVVRSAQPNGRPLAEYREPLRRDFLHLCAYCEAGENEVIAGAFEIEHYLPQGHYCALSRTYHNLMWACSCCNRSKSDHSPKTLGNDPDRRFLRPDEDLLGDHIQPDPKHDARVTHRTRRGAFHIEVLRLNRRQLTALRELRKRHESARSVVVDCMEALGRLRTHSLPERLRKALLAARGRAYTQRNRLDDCLRELIRSAMRSAQYDPDDGAVEQLAERSKWLPAKRRNRRSNRKRR